MSSWAKLIVGAALAAIVIYAALAFDVGRTPEVVDFSTCAAAGYPIMESYPRQCRDGEGNLFVEEIAGSVLADMIRVAAPAKGAAVSSPISVSGEARGTWYFEASFPVQILDGNGKVIGQGPATAEGEWMTTEFVPFSASIKFDAPATATGTVRFMKDNPSGMPELDAALDVPVTFSGVGAQPNATSTSAVCRTTGCSGQICSDQDVMSTCEYKEEYACYQGATCARQADGQCGWTQTAALTACLSGAR